MDKKKGGEKMIRPAWFARSIPREWGGGKVRVDGDNRAELIAALLTVGKVIAGIAIAWLAVATFFCATGNK